MRRRNQGARAGIYGLLLVMLMCISCHELAAQAYEVKFDSINAYGWFGGDNRPMQQRTIGVGQSVFIDTSITLNSFSFFFRGPFDFFSNPEGRGHEVTLTLNVRDSLGVILRTVQVVVPDTFKTGWVTWPNIALDVSAKSTLIFTAYLVGGFDANQYTASHAAHAQQGYPHGVRYGKDGVSDADMENWTDWNQVSWDSAFWLQGTILTVTGVESTSGQVPARYELRQNYPNPFNPSTVISFQLPVNSVVQLTIYNATSQLVRKLASGKFASGRHQVVWDGKDDRGQRVASGSYFYQLTAGDFQSTRRMILIK
jgi:hypothetical protein